MRPATRSIVIIALMSVSQLEQRAACSVDRAGLSPCAGDTWRVAHSQPTAKVCWPWKSHESTDWSMVEHRRAPNLKSWRCSQLCLHGWPETGKESREQLWDECESDGPRSRVLTHTCSSLLKLVSGTWSSHKDSGRRCTAIGTPFL